MKKEPVFFFAVISDSHMNPIEGESSSPWEINKLTNARNRYVIQELNRLSPEFVIHLGDLVHPVPAVPSYGEAADRFHELFKDLESQLYLAPGNHDIGDKPSPWLPAGIVRDEYIDLYRKHFGNNYYSFDFNECHFVIFDSQVMNSDLACEKEQRKWLARDLEDNKNKRIFMFTHYPPYITKPDEDAHYDNIEEPARSWLLKLMEDNKVEALFAGHVHNFSYNRHAYTECYVLPSIAFTRQDYSEFYRIEADAEHGRNDSAKLGYFVVNIYENEHVAHKIRSFGSTISSDQTMASESARMPICHTKEALSVPIGVDLRLPWAEVTELPYNGALDEFYRKRVRNDNPIAGLWEMGISKLRVPRNDILDDTVRERMYHMKKMGHEFTVFTYDIPKRRLKDKLKNNHDLITGLEVILPWDDPEKSLTEIRDFRKDVSIPIYLSKLRSHSDDANDDSIFKHFVNHGFKMNEREAIESFLKMDGAAEAVDGFAFRVGRASSFWTEIIAANSLVSSLDKKAEIYIRLANDNPVLSEKDDKANANRIAEAVFASLAFSDMEIFLDTYVDIDRGYFPRNGLVDRRYNPRIGSYVFKYLHTAVRLYSNKLIDVESYRVRGGQIFLIRGEEQIFALALPDAKLSLKDVHTKWNLSSPSGLGKCVDLITGNIGSFNWDASVFETNMLFELKTIINCSGPTLLIFLENK